MHHSALVIMIARGSESEHDIDSTLQKNWPTTVRAVNRHKSKIWGSDTFSERFTNDRKYRPFTEDKGINTFDNRS